MGVEIIRSPDYDRNEARVHGNDTPCIVCGRPVKDPWPYWVHLGINGLAITDAEAAEDPELSQGAWPIGKKCWKDHPELHCCGGSKSKNLAKDLRD